MQTVPISSGYHRSLSSSHPHPSSRPSPAAGGTAMSSCINPRGVSAMEKSFFSPLRLTRGFFLPHCLPFTSPALLITHSLSSSMISKLQHQPAAGQRGTEIRQNHFFTILFQGRVSCGDYGMLLSTGLAVPYPEIRAELPIDISRVCNWEG